MAEKNNEKSKQIIKNSSTCQQYVDFEKQCNYMICSRCAGQIEWQENGGSWCNKCRSYGGHICPENCDGWSPKDDEIEKIRRSLDSRITIKDTYTNEIAITITLDNADSRLELEILQEQIQDDVIAYVNNVLKNKYIHIITYVDYHSARESYGVSNKITYECIIHSLNEDKYRTAQSYCKKHFTHEQFIENCLELSNDPQYKCIHSKAQNRVCFHAIGFTD